MRNQIRIQDPVGRAKFQDPSGRAKFPDPSGRAKLSPARFLLTLLSLAWCLSACTTLAVNVPMPLVMSPEVSGRAGNIGLHVGIQDSQQVNVTDSANARPPDFSNSHIDHSVIVPVGISFGILDRSEVTGSFSALLGSAWLLGQIQVLGEPNSTAADDNLSLALQLMAGAAWTSASGDQAVTFGPGGSPWHGSAQYSFAGPGLSVGHRINEYLLLFGGFAYNWYRGHASVIQDQSKDGTSAGGKYTLDSHGTATNITVALKWGRRFSFMPSASYVVSQFSALPVTVDWRLSGQLDWQF